LAGTFSYLIALLLETSYNPEFLTSSSFFFFCRFAAALAELKVDCWVLNVIPVSGPNTLPVIYDRGLLGVMHDW